MPADVALLGHYADDAALRTLRAAVAREGWNVAAEGEPAKCAIVVWSQDGVINEELTRAAHPYVDRRRIVQILWQPKDWWYGMQSQVEAPEPFRYYQSLKVPYRDLDGSEHAVDWFEFSAGQGQRILAEVARLGELRRPCDDWNASIRFFKPDPLSLTPKVVLVEYAKANGRVLRRRKVDSHEPYSEDFRTTIGNRWVVLDAVTGEELQVLEVEQEDSSVHLPERKRWWRGLLHD